MFEVSHNHHVKQSFVDSLQNRTVDRFRVLNAMVSSCQFHSEEGNLEVSKQAMEEAAPRPQKCNQEIPGKGVDCNLEFIDFLRGALILTHAHTEMEGMYLEVSKHMSTRGQSFRWMGDESFWISSLCQDEIAHQKFRLNRLKDK